MKTKTSIETLNARIAELRTIQQQEVSNNFLNGDLWNNCEDAIWCLGKFGQENYPKHLYDENGVKKGYELNDGTKVYWSGMTFENSY
jgi:hypothetical protein